MFVSMSNSKNLCGNFRVNLPKNIYPQGCQINCDTIMSHFLSRETLMLTLPRLKEKHIKSMALINIL